LGEHTAVMIRRPFHMPRGDAIRVRS
jgi:hypothetical protein